MLVWGPTPEEQGQGATPDPLGFLLSGKIQVQDILLKGKIRATVTDI